MTVDTKKYLDFVAGVTSMPSQDPAILQARIDELVSNGADIPHLLTAALGLAADKPWNLSFSYGRALQHSALRAWGGSNETEGQKFVLARAQANSEASKGLYVLGSQPSSDEKLFVAGYTY